MLKTYRIIPFTFILFLFGFTFPKTPNIPDALVNAQRHWDPSMGMRHPDRPCMDRRIEPGGCGHDHRSSAEKANDPYDTNNPASQAARDRIAAQSAEQMSTSPSGGEVLETAGADDGMGDPNMPPPMGDPNMPLEQQGAPADPSGGEVARLNARMAELETQLSVANTAQEPLNAKVTELETQLSASNAAQEPLNARMAELEQVLNKLVADVRSFISHPLHDVVSLKYALRMALERTGL